MRCIKTLRPGDKGTKRWMRKFGRHLVAVRYRVDPKARLAITTVEVAVGRPRFYDPTGYESWKKVFGI
jgi:hypothetical protein